MGAIVRRLWRSRPYFIAHFVLCQIGQARSNGTNVRIHVFLLRIEQNIPY